jgi:hypothetical protein
MEKYNLSKSDKHYIDFRNVAWVCLVKKNDDKIPENKLHSKQIKIDDLNNPLNPENWPEYKKLTKKQQEKLKKMAKDMKFAAFSVVEDYKKNPSEVSGSVTHVHENSPALDTEKDSDEPLYSGSRWKKVLKTKL